MSRKPHLRTRVALVVTVTVVAVLALAQIGSAQSANPRRVEREIEIMAGILETTLRFAIEESAELTALQSEKEKFRNVVQLDYVERNRSKSVRGYYLDDQGVAFVVRARGGAKVYSADPFVTYGKFKWNYDALIGDCVSSRPLPWPPESRRQPPLLTPASS